MHRKKTKHPKPIGMIVAFLVLFALTVGLFYGLFAIAGPAPAAANTAMLRPAATAAATLRPSRPVWDGYIPERYTGPHPMCPASSYRLHRWARADQNGPWFRVECLPLGGGWFAWEGIAP